MTKKEITSKKIILFRTVSILFGIVVSCAIGEGVLRAIDFNYSLYPSKVQFGWPDPVTLKDVYRVDKKVLWVPKEYYRWIKIWKKNRPKIIFMGDSCTEFGRYDLSLQKLIARRNGRNVRFANVGVGGWSTYQGLWQLKRDLVPIKPKVITIYYGWNDHWKSFGIEDKDISKYNRDHSLLITFSKSRLIQLVNFVLLNTYKKDTKASKHTRVSLADFKENLRKIITTAQSNTIVPVLITAPSSHTIGEEPPYLQERWISDLSTLVPLHQKYVQAVREIANERRTPLIDLAKEFDLLPKKDVKNRYFKSDGIHSTPEGDVKIAEIIYEGLLKNNLLKLLY